jgi:hypothetical protein
LIELKDIEKVLLKNDNENSDFAERKFVSLKSIPDDKMDLPITTTPRREKKENVEIDL